MIYHSLYHYIIIMNDISFIYVFHIKLFVYLSEKPVIIY